MNKKYSNNDWYYVMKINPFTKEEDIEEIRYVNNWDVLIVYKDGRKFLYDTFTNFFRILHNDDYTLTEQEEKKEFAYNLRSIMNRKWITQEELGKRIGVNQTMISHYTTGRKMPSTIMLRKIAKVLNCSMDDFFYRQY